MNKIDELTKNPDRRAFLKYLLGGAAIGIPAMTLLQGCGMPNDPLETMYTKDLLAGIKDTYRVGTETYRYLEGHFKKLYVNGVEYTGAGGASAFIDLSDVPSDYTGHAGEYTRVNVGENGLEFGTPAGSGDMEKATYDPDDDGVIALAQLDPDVCSESEADGKITTHAGDASAHHARYTDGEAVSAMGVKGNANPLNHDRYTDLEAIGAMGAKANNNPLNHDRYTDNEAIAAAKTIKLDDFTTPDDNTDLNATVALHGLMSKTDKSKLDSIESGATKYPDTGEEVYSSAEKAKLATIEASADATDAANVDAAGAVMEADYNANTILAATLDNTPAAITIGEQTLVGRKTGGNITALSSTEVRTILNVADGADVTANNAPKAHNISHQSGGGDAIKIDDLATPDDNTDLNASSTVHGLFPKLSGCSAYLENNQSVNSGSTTKILCNIETYDIGGEYDNVTNYRFVAAAAGYYLIIGTICVSALAANKYASCIIQKDGVGIVEANEIVGGTASDTRVQAATIAYLAATNYIELYCYHTHGSARNVAGGIGNTNLRVQRIG